MAMIAIIALLTAFGVIALWICYEAVKAANELSSRKKPKKKRPQLK